jgi:hypothetical protein
MAIQAYVADVPARKRPIDEHGKERYIYSKTTVAIIGDIGSTFLLGMLPPGAVRVLLNKSYIQSSAMGAGVTLSIGHGAYRFKQDQAAPNDGIQAAVANAFANALSVAAAGVTVFNASALKFDLFSQAGVQVIATSAGAVVPVNATLEMLLAYIYE